MAVINIGSINIDHVYQVAHFVQPGETIGSNGYQQLLGGKGANQSIALAKAGNEVKHLGRLHESDASFKQAMIKYGVDCRYVKCSDSASGHAIIQVTEAGENAIVLFGGANHELALKDIQNAINDAAESDWVLLQNETNGIADAIHYAKESGIKVAFNPAPMTESVKQLPLSSIDLLVVNEVEAAEIVGSEELSTIETYFREHMPDSEVIITLGKSGVLMLKSNESIKVDAFVVDAVDTTAAGDTFIGYFLSSYSKGLSAKDALIRATAASALTVTKAGAAQAIPTADEVDAFLATQAG